MSEIKKERTFALEYKGTHTLNFEQFANVMRRIGDVLDSEIGSNWCASACWDTDQEKTLFGGWIPCAERLPDKDGTYLVTERNYHDGQTPYIKKAIVHPLCFAGGKWLDNARIFSKERSNVIAWKTMPEPYIADEN